MNKENDFSLFFKDKIDWKLIEFLRDKALCYEDDGATIYVYAYINENKPIMVLATSNDDIIYSTTRMKPEYVKMNENGGLIYGVTIDGLINENNLLKCKNLIDKYRAEYINRVKSKFTLISESGPKMIFKAI